MKSFTINKALVVLLFSSLIGLIASFILTLDKIQLLQNPSFSPSCNLNPIISCLSAMGSEQSEVLGVPNSLIGLILYTALSVVVALLILKVTLPKIAWRLMLGACAIGVIFVHYLIIQSIFVLSVICPWCLSIWLTTPLLVLAFSSEYSRHVQPLNTSAIIDRIPEYLSKQKLTLAVIWYTSLILCIAVVFKDYWVNFIF